MSILGPVTDHALLGGTLGETRDGSRPAFPESQSIPTRDGTGLEPGFGLGSRAPARIRGDGLNSLTVPLTAPPREQRPDPPKPMPDHWLEFWVGKLG
jgi:hypothetical protein